MSERYFGKVVTIQDKYTIVINAGHDQDVKIGQKFLVVGLGQTIVDPDTGEELEQLEIVRGRAQAMHVQQRIATLRSCDFEKERDVKEIKKVTSRGMGLAASLYGPQDTVTESVTPGAEHLKELNGVKVGDLLIRL